MQIKSVFIQPYLIAVMVSLFSLFSLVISGCINTKTLNVNPESTVFHTTATSIDGLLLNGQKVYPVVNQFKSDYDLIFSALDSENIQLTGGYQIINEIVYRIKLVDLGEKKYETVGELPPLDSNDYLWTDIVTALPIDQTRPQTIINPENIYGLYRYNSAGGNFAKITVISVVPQRPAVELRGEYQNRFNYRIFLSTP